MKTLSKSSIFAALVALFLSISLSGCFEEGAKTASQGGGVSSSVFDSGKVKLVLKPGAYDIYMGFFDNAARDKSAEAIRHEFENAGVTIKDLYKSENYLFVRFDPIGSELVVNFDKIGLRYIKLESPLRTVAEWDSSLGNEVRYAG